jgi:hypothetical protein
MPVMGVIGARKTNGRIDTNPNLKLWPHAVSNMKTRELQAARLSGRALWLTMLVTGAWRSP